MATKKKIFYTILATLLCLAVLRLFVFEVLTVSRSDNCAVFSSGDRLLVLRNSYGLRLPFSNAIGYHRLWHTRASKGEWLAFNCPADTGVVLGARRAMVGQCIAVPGDTVWFSWNLRLVSRSYPSSVKLPFVVPGRGVSVDVKPWNARLLYLTLSLHEGRTGLRLVGDTAIADNGKPLRRVAVSQDYYWVMSSCDSDVFDSRSFGFVPESHLIGRLLCVLYSCDTRLPFYQSFRADRLLHGLPRSVVAPLSAQ